MLLRIYKILLLVLVFQNRLLLPLDVQESKAVGNISDGVGVAILNSHTTIEGMLNSMGDFSVNTNQFNVTAASGDTTIGGALDVTGDTSVGGALGVAGVLTLNDDLRVTGSTTVLGTFAVNQNKMTVDAGGNTLVAGTLGATGNFSVNTNKFNIAAATGNTIIGGTLGSTGNFSVNNNKFNVAANTGNTAIAGTLGVSGISTLSNDLRITGSTSFLGKLSVNQNKMTVDALGNTFVGGTLNVAGATTLNSLTVINNETVGGNLNVTGATTLVGNTIEHGTLTVTGSTSHLGAVGLASTLNVAGATTLNSLTISGGMLDVSGGLGSGWHHIFGEKSLTSIGTTATPVLSITFANLTGSTNPLVKGARINVHAIISGLVTSFLTSTNSIIYYYGDFIVSPGATATSPCTLITVASTATCAAGTSTTLVSSITGSGTGARLNLATSLAISNPSVAIFYEIMSDNISSVS